MKLIVERGATKTAWRSISSDGIVREALASGLNPTCLDEEHCRDIMRSAIPVLNPSGETVGHVYFYGAGLVSEESASMLRACLDMWCPFATVEFHSDILAAARALFGDGSGVVAIMGTGSNSCLYENGSVVRNIRPGGFILGDEGSGASLGKAFLADFVKGLLPSEIEKELVEETGLDYAQVVRKVYKEPAASAFMASFAPFVMERIGHPYMYKLVHDCLETGVDIEKGGARYNWIMPSFVGMANLVDSLEAVRTLVYEQKRYTMAEFLEILRKNFEGEEALRQEILRKLPHYGNCQPSVDNLIPTINGWIVEECARYTNYRGDKFIPSLFCWIMHEQLGKNTGATPDGRLAGQAFGDGSGPAQGREYQGPTASLLSATSWDHEPFLGDIAVNYKFDAKFFTGETRQKMKALLSAFLERGGFETQVNVVSAETLLAARKNPELYQDLVVRIGGYAEYFNRLSPALRAAVVARNIHE